MKRFYRVVKTQIEHQQTPKTFVKRVIGHLRANGGDWESEREDTHPSLPPLVYSEDPEFSIRLFLSQEDVALDDDENEEAKKLLTVG